MLSTQHAIVGSAIAVATGNPVLGFFGGIASHHILDCIPHYDGGLIRIDGRRFMHKKDENWPKHVYVLAYADSIVTLGILIVVGFLTDKWLLVFIGALGGTLPDLFDNVPWWKDRFRKTRIGRTWHRFHEICHYHWKNARLIYIIFAICLQIFITIGGIWVSLKNF